MIRKWQAAPKRSGPKRGLRELVEEFSEPDSEGTVGWHDEETDSVGSLHPR